MSDEVIGQVLILLATLAGAGSIVGIVVRSLVDAPRRESKAYQQGISDESRRCAKMVEGLRTDAARQDAKIQRFEDALMQIAIELGLDDGQRLKLVDIVERARQAVVPVEVGDEPVVAPPTEPAGKESDGG